MEETYKGYTIVYEDSSSKFKATIGASNYHNSSLSAVKKYIDHLERKDFKRVDVIVEDYKGMTDAIVTSYPEGQEHSGYKECWISFKENTSYHSRAKMCITNVFLDNPHNREIIAQMDEKENLFTKIKDQLKELRNTLETYNPDN